MKLLTICVIVILIAIVVLLVMNEPPFTTFPPFTPKGLEISNPATTYCIDNGGTYKITESLCILKDGTQCDEWKYFRGECP